MGEPELTWLTLTSLWKRGRGTRKHMPLKLGESSRREPETVELERLTSMCWNHRILAALCRSCWLPRMTAAVQAKHSSSEALNRVTAALSGRQWALVRQLVVACSIEVHGWEEVGLENGPVQGRRADWEGTLQPKLMLLFHDHRTELCQIHAGPPNPAIGKGHMGTGFPHIRSWYSCSRASVGLQ